jgi:hypothetical protein
VLLGLPVFANDIFTSWAKAVMDLLFPGEAFGVDTVLVNKYTFLGEACFSRHLDCARALVLLPRLQLFRSIFRDGVFPSKIRPSTPPLTDLDGGVLRVGVVGMSNAMFSCSSEGRKLSIAEEVA